MASPFMSSGAARRSVATTFHLYGAVFASASLPRRSLGSGPFYESLSASLEGARGCGCPCGCLEVRKAPCSALSLCGRSTAGAREGLSHSDCDATAVPIVTPAVTQPERFQVEVLELCSPPPPGVSRQLQATTPVNASIRHAMTAARHIPRGGAGRHALDTYTESPDLACACLTLPDAAAPRLGSPRVPPLSLLARLDSLINRRINQKINQTSMLRFQVASRDSLGEQGNFWRGREGRGVAKSDALGQRRQARGPRETGRPGQGSPGQAGCRGGSGGGAPCGAPPAASRAIARR